jgi:hypothetical protein
VWHVSTVLSSLGQSKQVDTSEYSRDTPLFLTGTTNVTRHLSALWTGILLYFWPVPVMFPDIYPHYGQDMTCTYYAARPVPQRDDGIRALSIRQRFLEVNWVMVEGNERHPYYVYLSIGRVRYFVLKATTVGRPTRAIRAPVVRLDWESSGACSLMLRRRDCVTLFGI